VGTTLPIDRSAVASFLRHGHLTAGRSIHTGVRQVRPGTVVTLGADGRATETVWWSLEAVVEAGAASRQRPVDPATEREHLDEMDELLGRAVRSRMVADVPLGAFLSGGVDSSTVVALMQEQSGRAIETFSIGSRDPGYDESSFARAVAQHLGTHHTEVVLDDAEVVALVPSILADLDEPLADPSLVPTWLVSRLARRHVTVALSGDGGDEVFGGYTRHRIAASRMVTLLGLPSVVKRPLAAGLRVVPPRAWDALAGLLPPSRRPGRAGEQVQKVARVLGARDVDELHRRLVAVWEDGPAAVRGAVAAFTERQPSGAAARLALHPSERMMFTDTLSYLVDDVLVKVDRASMAHSLEVRVPLLDHRVVERAWALPLSLRVRGSSTKWVLREVLARRVPPALTERPKRGFAQPIGAWLRGPLRPWAEDLLSPLALERVGLVRSGPVRVLWSEHLSGRADHHAALWAVLVLQSWSDAVGVTADAPD
jgi:asparagine synthase (glutamine-hydrolysing)